MVKLISAILSLTMLFGTGTAPNSTTVTANVPVTVGAQQAVYEQWTTNTTEIKSYDWEWKNETNIARSVQAYRVCDLNNSNGTYSLSDPITLNPQTTESCYQSSKVTGDWGFLLIKFIYVGNWNNKNWFDCYWATETIKSVESRDVFVKTVTAVNGSLPADGKHSDGYWYVLKNLVED